MIVAHGSMSQLGLFSWAILAWSQIITVRCWMGCNLLKAQLGWLSKRAAADVSFWVGKQLGCHTPSMWLQLLTAE